MQIQHGKIFNRSHDQDQNRKRKLEDRSPKHPRYINWFCQEYDPIKNGSIDGTDTKPHDRGLVRALKSKYTPWKDPKIKGCEWLTLFVWHINFSTTEERLHDVFSQHGTIKSLRLVRDKVTGKSKGYAFVEYEKEKAFRRAYDKMHKAEIDGFIIFVEHERGRTMPGWKPRRLGGGLGGKKESGQLRFGGRVRPFRAPYHPDTFNKDVVILNQFDDK